MKTAGRVLSILLLTLAAGAADARQVPRPEREFRAVWVATVNNIDFPTKNGLRKRSRRPNSSGCWSSRSR